MLIPFAVESYREWEQRRDRAVVTYVILATCVAAHFFVWHTLSEDARLEVFYRFGVVKYDFRWYSAITCTLLHGGWIHLIGNLFYLWVYGTSVERLLGRLRFLAIYLIGAVCSVAVHLITVSDTMVDVPTVGASGAISAVLGAFFVLLPKAKLKCAFVFFLRPLIANLPAWIVLGLWFLMQLYMSADPMASSGEVAFWAHVGGFCTGALLGSYLGWRLHRGHEVAAQAWRVPLQRAWAAYLRGDEKEAWRCYATFSENTNFPGPEEDYLLAGLLGAQGNESGSPDFDALRAFNRAAASFDLAGAVTIYNHMVHTLDPKAIPPEIHREAGEAALSCNLPEFGLRAFLLAFETGLSEGRQDVVRRSVAAARHKMGKAELADQLEAIL